MYLNIQLKKIKHINYIRSAFFAASTHLSAASCRVQLQKMEIVRPPADVARYTMVFHKRDAGNEVNKDR